MASDDEDDLDAMWDDLGDGDDGFTANISGNLAEAVGAQATIVHKDDIDEGRVTWEAPQFHGLQNSNEVTVGDRHWYKDDEAAAPPPAAVEAAAPAQPAFQMPFQMPFQAMNFGAPVGEQPGAVPAFGAAPGAAPGGLFNFGAPGGMFGAPGAAPGGLFGAPGAVPGGLFAAGSMFGQPQGA